MNKLLFLMGIGLIAFSFLGSSIWKWIGHLPGDFVWKKEHFTLYVPLTTSLVISLILSFLTFLFLFFRK